MSLFDLTGAHKKKADLGVARQAELPKAVSRLDFESNHVVIGSKEPEEGRFHTLSRLSYKHGQASACGDETSIVESAAKLKVDARQRALANQTRNFVLPLDDRKNLPLVSEVHQAQQTSQEILSAYQRRHKRGEVGVFVTSAASTNHLVTENFEGTATLGTTSTNTTTTTTTRSLSPLKITVSNNNHSPSSSLLPSSSASPGSPTRNIHKVEKVYKQDEVLANIQQASDTREHMIRMNATSILEGANKDQPTEQRRERNATFQSTQRSAFQPRDSADAAAERKRQATELKKMQTKSSATPIEDVPTRWASEARSNFATKVTPAPPALCTTAQRQNLKLDDAEGRELARTGEALRSLYQADLRNHGKEGHAATPVISWHGHQISLGSEDRKTAASLYRASFTPTIFVAATAAAGGTKIMHQSGSK